MRHDRAVSPACICEKRGSSDPPPPYDHFTAGPDCRVIGPANGRVGSVGSSPTIRAGVVSPAGVEIIGTTIPSAPDDHFTAAPHRGVQLSGRGRIGGAGARPTIRAGIVSPASVHIAGDSSPAPNDHLIASPNSGMRDPASRR